MKAIDPRWWIAGFVALVWGAAVIIDAFSLSYTVDSGLHIGCGGILGVLIGTASLGTKKGKEDG